MFNNYQNPYAYGFQSQPSIYNSMYGQYQQPQPNQSIPNQQQPQPNSITNTNKIYVSGIEDVKSRFLSPNSDVLFIDNDKPLIYQKVVDSKGQFEIKVFDICPHIEQQEAKQEDTINLSNYVLKTDLEPLQAQIKELNDKLDKLKSQNQVNVIKKEEVQPLATIDNQ